jgi:6-phosphogluconolactonase
VARIAGGLREALSARGRAHLSLAGGSTPRRAYELLPPLLDDWSEVELWFGDERAVAPDHPESNFRMVAETLLAGGTVSSPQVHPIDAGGGTEAAAEAYEAELRSRLPSSEEGVPVLDVALLGLGPDGHVASLFPGHRALESRGRACVAVPDAPKPPPVRVTLTIDVLRSARRVLVLTTGESKAGAVAAALAGPDPEAPASLLAGAPVELVVDRAAAARAAGAAL